MAPTTRARRAAAKPAQEHMLARQDVLYPLLECDDGWLLGCMLAPVSAELATAVVGWRGQTSRFELKHSPHIDARGFAVLARDCAHLVHLDLESARTVRDEVIVPILKHNTQLKHLSLAQ